MYQCIGLTEAAQDPLGPNAFIFQMFGFEDRYGVDSTMRSLVNGTSSERENHHKKPESVSRRITYHLQLATLLDSRRVTERRESISESGLSGLTQVAPRVCRAEVQR